MTLKEIRKQFIEQAGRYDLGVARSADSYYDDNGANYYINAGLRMLGGLVDVPANETLTAASSANGTYRYGTSQDDKRKEKEEAEGGRREAGRGVQKR